MRLGEDVFREGKISKETGDRLVDSMRAFAAIMKVNGWKRIEPVPSAMREAKNAARWFGKFVVQPESKSKSSMGRRSASYLSRQVV